MCSLVYAGFVPHPPLLIDGIADEQKELAAATDKAYRQFALGLKQCAPDRVVIFSPHGPVFSDTYVLPTCQPLQGNFAPFGSAVSMTWPGDRRYSQRALALAADRGLPLAGLSSRDLAGYGYSASLDHGALLPLWYLQQAGWQGKVVTVQVGGLPGPQCSELGKIFALAAGEERTALIASGDMSHCLTKDAPSPFNPAGPEFDSIVVQALRNNDWPTILNIGQDLRRRAAECGWRPLVTLLGALIGHGFTSEVLSYEGPFGVGYLVAVFEQPQGCQRDGSPHVKLARWAIRQYLATGHTPKVEAIEPLIKKGAAFVSLKLAGRLRGCIGTFLPTEPSLAQEIAANAVAAATRDPRFTPVTAAELGEVAISVDVLSAPVAADFSQLDPAKFGLIARWHGRQGLLLPDLPGVETPTEQLQAVCYKAGIPWDRAGEASLSIFTVQRFY